MSRPVTAIDPRKQPRQRRAAVTVDLILEGAARILEREGLAGFNTNVVAAKAGVSVGSLYQYFPTKEAILVALIRRKRAGLLAEIRTLAAVDAAGADLATVLGRAVDVVLAPRIRRPALLAALEQAEEDLPIDAETQALKQAIVQEIAGILATYRVGAPMVAARDLVAMARGMLALSGPLADGDPATLAERVRRAALGYLAPVIVE